MTAALRSRQYADGKLVSTADTLTQACDQYAAGRGLSVILLDDGDADDLALLADRFGFHPLAVEDALEAHQRPKLDRYGDTTFVALRPARYLDEPEIVEFGELHLFVGPDFAVLVSHGAGDVLDSLVARLDSEEWLSRRGGTGVLYTALDCVVDMYEPVLDGLENDIDEIVDQVFTGAQPGVARRIYQLSREAVGLQRAVHPLTGVLIGAGLALDAAAAPGPDRAPTPPAPPGMHPGLVGMPGGRDLAPDPVLAGLADVKDHVHQAADRVDALRASLSDILQTHATLVGLDQNTRTEQLSEAQYRQNEQVKRISSWAAILLAPTIVTGIYGMNFTAMPELGWRYGYPGALALMVVASALLYYRFRRIGWI